MTAEGVSLRNEFCCTTFRGYVNRDDSGFLAQTNDELTSCEAFCSVSRRSELEWNVCGVTKDLEWVAGDGVTFPKELCSSASSRALWLRDSGAADSEVPQLFTHLCSHSFCEALDSSGNQIWVLGWREVNCEERRAEGGMTPPQMPSSAPQEWAAELRCLGKL